MDNYTILMAVYQALHNEKIRVFLNDETVTLEAFNKKYKITVKEVK